MVQKTIELQVQLVWVHDPGRVLPGKKMAGQMGNKTANIKKLKIIQVNSEENILVVKGSVPGKPGNLLSIVLSE